MKKLMIAAAIVCAAVAAQATTQWILGVDNFMNHSGSAYTGNVKLYYYLDSAGESSAQEITTDHPFVVESGLCNDYFDSDDLLAETDYYFYFTAEEDGWTFKSNAEWAYKYEFEILATPIEFSSPTESATWSVPEPTSGLLMLLGMAGLCLRRKQRG